MQPHQTTYLLKIIGTCTFKAQKTWRQGREQAKRKEPKRDTYSDEVI